MDNLQGSTNTIPVLFVTYTRVEYARQTFNAIKHAKPSRLYFYSNKARNDKPEEVRKNNQIREFTNEIDWNCELFTFFREEYVDIYSSLWGAFDWIFENEEKAIILEEDCVPSPAFFDFCDQMLEKYRHDNRIWVISGNNFIENFNPNKYDYFFSYFPFMYGWASWRNRWQKVIRGPLPFDRIKDYRLFDQIYADRNAAKEALKFTEKIINTPAWDYRFTISMKCNGGFGIIPKVNLVSNIGLSGTHNKGRQSIFHERSLPDFEKYVIDKHPPFIVPDFGYSRYWYDNYYLKRKRFFYRLKKRILNFIKGELYQMRIRLINNFRDLLLNILKKAYIFYKKYKIRNSFKRIYTSDMVRYLKYSRTFGADDPVKMIGSIILQYHVIEKGLTMPDPKMGFGKERVIALCRDCIKYIQKYGQNDEQVEHAIGVILEYEYFHKINGFDLNNDVDGAILQLKNNLRSSVEKTAQIRTGKNQYFSQTESPFPEFANSRCSVRNYSSEEVNIKDINDALELARNTPSACNRQSWRTYVFTRKDMIPRLLEIQGGNRGFGHLANKLIIVTGELGLFCNSNERNQVYIDGGLYAMNLLYTLHYLGIAACVLNCSFDPEKDRDLKKISGIKDSEVLIVMIACGIPKDEFIVALSPRYPVEKTNSMIN